MTGLLVCLVGLVLLSAGVLLGASALLGALGSAAACVLLGCGWVALGALIDFDKLRGRP